MLTPPELERLAHEPESDHLEHQPSLHDVLAAASELAALANSGGGFLLVGVDDTGHVPGVDDPDAVRRSLEEAMYAITPAPEVDIYEGEVDGEPVVVAEVGDDDALHLAPDGAFTRRLEDGTTVPLSGAELATGLDETPDHYVRRMVQELHRQMDAEHQRAEKERAAAQREREQAQADRTPGAKWKERIFSGLVGAVLGAAAGVPVALLLGI